MGPWIHNAQSSSSHGQVYFGKDAAIADAMGWRLEWFDHWLKGRDNAIGRTAPFATKVRIFVMGTGDGRKTGKGFLHHGGSWHDEQEWPLARTRPTAYYFQGDGKLSPEKPGGRQESTSYQFDPKNPVPTLGCNISSANDIMQAGAWDQRGGEKFWNWPSPCRCPRATMSWSFRLPRWRRTRRSPARSK